MRRSESGQGRGSMEIHAPVVVRRVVPRATRTLEHLAHALRLHWAVLLGLIAVALLVVAVGPHQLGQSLGRVNPWLLAAMLGCVLAAYAARGLVWWIEIRALGHHTSLVEAERVVFVSQAFVLMPGGDMWRVPLMRSDGDEGDAGTLAGAVTFDNIVYFAALSLVMLVAGAAAHGLTALAWIALPQALIVMVLLWPRVFRTLVHLVTRIGPARRLEPLLTDLGTAFRTMARPTVLLRVVAADVVNGCLFIGLYALALDAVHVDAGWRQVAVIYVFGQVLAGITVLPGALGLYEGLMTALFTAAGVPVAAAAAAALLYRGFNDVVMALLGVALAAIGDRAGARRGRPRAPVPVSWQLVRLGVPGHPRAGVLLVWRLAEAIMLHLHHVRPVRPGGLLLYETRTHRGRPVVLADGTRVEPGAPLIEIHLDNRANRKAAAVPMRERMDTFATDMLALRGLLHEGHVRPPVAIHGQSQFVPPDAMGLGFEHHRVRDSIALRFQRLFFAGLVMYYNPRHWSAVVRQKDRWPQDLWMSWRQLERYRTASQPNTAQLTVHGRGPVSRDRSRSAGRGRRADP